MWRFFAVIHAATVQMIQGGGLHRCSGQAGASRCEGDACERADDDGDDIEFSGEAMQAQIARAESRRELQRSGEERERACERVRNQELTVGDHLKAIGVIHRVIDEQERLGRDDDEERREAERDPESALESRVGRRRTDESGRRHLSWKDAAASREVALNPATATAGTREIRRRELRGYGVGCPA